MRDVKDAILPKVRKIAESENIKEFEENVKSLDDNPLWQRENSNKFRVYFETTWFSIKEVYVAR